MVLLPMITATQCTDCFLQSTLFSLSARKKICYLEKYATYQLPVHIYVTKRNITLLRNCLNNYLFHQHIRYMLQTKDLFTIFLIIIKCFTVTGVSILLAKSRVNMNSTWSILNVIQNQYFKLEHMDTGNWIRWILINEGKA